MILNNSNSEVNVVVHENWEYFLQVQITYLNLPIAIVFSLPLHVVVKMFVFPLK